MCGIFGTNRLNPITREMMPMLAVWMEARGKDSWGATNGVEVFKKVGKVSNGFRRFKEWEGERVLYHTRKCTHGAVTDANCHPFTVEREGRRVIGVHNGMVLNHTELNRKYGRDFDVDSQHIFAHICEKKGLDELDMNGAIVWFEGEDGRMRLFCAKSVHGELAMAQGADGEVVWASTKTSITYATKMLEMEEFKDIVIEPRKKYEIEEGGVKEVEEFAIGLAIKETPDVSGDAYHLDWGHYGYWGRNGNWIRGVDRYSSPPSPPNHPTNLPTRYLDDTCLSCFVNRVPRTVGILCKSCLRTFLETGKVVGEASGENPNTV